MGVEFQMPNPNTTNGKKIYAVIFWIMAVVQFLILPLAGFGISKFEQQSKRMVELQHQINELRTQQVVNNIQQTTMIDLLEKIDESQRQFESDYSLILEKQKQEYLETD